MFFVELSRAIERLHARGVAHLDLRQRRNVLIDGRGRPVLVDFAAAIVSRTGSPLRLAFPLFRAIDRGAVLKHRRLLAPSGLSERERRADRFFGALGRLWRIVRLH
jgi:serine/threonine protein kinase